MTRYIDAVELIKAIEESQRNTEHHKDGRGKQIHVSEHRHFIKMVYEQSTADVQEVRHAKWITIGKDITERIVCSNCHSHKGSNLKPPFCNQCGAKMDGKE